MYNDKIKDIEDKIPDITNLATNTTLNTKINEVKNEIPLKKEQKKQIMMQKYHKMGSKYFTTSDFNKFTSNILGEKITQKNAVNKNDFNEKMEILATKEEIKTSAK